MERLTKGQIRQMLQLNKITGGLKLLKGVLKDGAYWVGSQRTDRITVIGKVHLPTHPQITIILFEFWESEIEI